MKKQVNFLHIPKCDGNSLKEIAGGKVKVWGHKYKYVIPSPSFCFVRNPFDRLVSAYYYLLNGGNGNEPDLSYSEILKKVR